MASKPINIRNIKTVSQLYFKKSGIHHITDNFPGIKSLVEQENGILLKILFFMPKRAFCDTLGISFEGRFLLGGWWYPPLK